MSTLAAQVRYDDETERGEARWPDFRITFSETTGWRIAVLSWQASRWLKESLTTRRFAKAGDMIQTDITGVNYLLHKARCDGLKTEYVGKLQTVEF
ncbi:hypothetical protein [Roseibium salinum]|uniref:Uncharacterized protein n=1 Tax=Roseibium salinum TaxID=1604349 RepID=A0ABT3QWJ5_9HYPH|nr:hypothetical protein [Roseibium sp. DSM 29163]MCX2721303.1 hypothetical protein [Roseibium sp. DSM 29163]MDN3722171.1 hypothetical protein [Roseibium salinum]